ncbi:hypothetical protein PPERSA_05002 [Pseudocohnilembus persalinus]|uniref:Uncharacterized protein n=1 Tax=Pseudocohnilembus persalinus TaxID=266149 RepID=A0A0V0QX05_PSEPJ|nr:hypothetical protein PPERSA_05002 [Pseudocohnilembus persalinus]|eukprot:KRX06389.1 hypothetical protein PPERSA_05002 [Pseudocohnilembus persalinus]
MAEQKKKYNFGILSTANISIKLAQAIDDSSDANLYGIASRSLEKAQKWTKENNYNIKTYGSYQELLDDQNIDLVYIPLPTGYKYEWAVKAAEKGKHILVEKPLCGETDTQQLQQLLKLCKEKNVQFMDCTMFVHSPRTLQIEEKLKNQELGQICQVIAGFSMYFSPENREENIRSKLDLEPLGALGDMTWYSCMATNVGFQFEKPEKFQALSWKKAENGSIYQFSGAIFYSNNRIAYVDGSYCEALRDSFQIVGEKGNLRVTGFVGGDNEESGKLSVYTHRFKGAGSYVQAMNMEQAQTINMEKTDQVVCMVNDFVDLVKNNDQSQKWGKRTQMNQSFVVHLYKSVQENGAVVKFDENL